MKGLNTRVFDFNFVCGVDFFPIGLCDQNQLQNNYENRIKMYVTRDVVPVDRKKDVKCRHTHSLIRSHTQLHKWFTKTRSRASNSFGIHHPQFA